MLELRLLGVGVRTAGLELKLRLVGRKLCDEGISSMRCDLGLKQ